MPPVNVITPEGEPTQVDDSELQSALMAGYTVETSEQAASRNAEAAAAEQFGGAGSAIEAGVYGAARGASFGLSDVALRAGGADPKALQGLREQQRGVSLGSEIAGAVVPSLLTGGAGTAGAVARATPAGATSKLALGITERIAGQAPGIGRNVVATAAGGAVEGGIQNLGSYVSDVALGNKKLSAEGALGSLGSGGVFGGLAGGAFGGIEKGTIAARRLFPKSEAGERVVEAAEKEFVAAAEDVARSGDDLARTAQQRLDDIALRRAELNLEKLKLKAQKDPAAAERLAEIRVEQARLVAARRAAKGEVDAERAARSAASPASVAPVAPQADGIVATADEVGGVADAVAAQTPAPPGDDLLAQLQGTQAQLDAGVPFTQIAPRPEEVIDDAILQADKEAARLQEKLDRFKQGRPMADDFIARYGGGARSRYSATGAGGTRGGGAGPVRTDRTRLLPDEEVEASINDRVFAGIGDARAPAAGDATRAPGAELDDAYEAAIESAALAPSRAAQERALREAADLEDQIFDTVAARGGRDADDVAKIRNKRGDLGQDSYTVALRRAEKRAMAEEARPPSSKTLDERADLAAFDRGLREQQFAGGKTAGEVAKEMTKPLSERILGPVAAKAAPTEAAGMGKFLDDADEAIRVIGEMEKATAELVGELGDAAPPAAKARAAQYMQAVDDQARKIAEKTAMSADDAVRAGSLVSLPKPPPVPASQARKIGANLADAAAVLDTIQTFGDIPGMPNPRDIPVIGPVLSMYLKVRAGRMALKKIGGRIGATPEAKIAAKSAELRDRAAAAVDRILVGASRTARVARQPAVAAGTKLMDSLSHRLYPQEERKEKPKTAVDAVKARVDELSAAATDPDGVRAAIRSAIRVADPDLSREIEDATIRKLDYLHKNAPKLPTPQLLGGRAWSPSKVEIEKFARRIRATEDPVSVLDDLEAGTLTTEAAEAMRVVYPTLFSEVQMRLIDRAAELEVSVPYKRRLTLSALFDVPLDDSLQPARLLQLQQIYNSGGASPDAAGAAPGGPQPPAPSVAAPVNISRLYADSSRMPRS